LGDGRSFEAMFLPHDVDDVSELVPLV